MGAAARDIALTAGTSAGILDIAMGHPWEAGDGVVLFQGEFPANTTPRHQAHVRHMHAEQKRCAFDGSQ